MTVTSINLLHERCAARELDDRELDVSREQVYGVLRSALVRDVIELYARLRGEELGGEVLDIALEEDCSFVIKPSAALDGEGDYARWGDTMVVTKTGAKRLGTRPQEMRILK